MEWAKKAVGAAKKVLIPFQAKIAKIFIFFIIKEPLMKRPRSNFRIQLVKTFHFDAHVKVALKRKVSRHLGASTILNLPRIIEPKLYAKLQYYWITGNVV